MTFWNGRNVKEFIYGINLHFFSKCAPFFLYIFFINDDSFHNFNFFKLKVPSHSL